MVSLKEKALKGIKWTALSSIVGALTQLVQLVVLTHFLAANEFGLMALALVVIGFSQMFIDMGVSNAIIHDQNITKKQLDSLYWLNVGAGIIVFFLLFLIAPIISSFYNEAKLTDVVRVVSIGFLIQPFEQQFLVLLKKELQFNQIAKRDVLSKVISFVVSVVLAVAGYGVYSLVIANLVSVIFSAVLIISIGLKHHRPSFHFNLLEIRSSMSFGLYQVGENFINYFVTQFDSILIGKILGMDALGIYNVAKNLAMRPSQVINPIVTQIGFPVMAKMQADLNKLKVTYLKIIHYLSSLNFPIYIFIALFAEQIILLLFGTKWTASIPIFRILALYAMVRSTTNPIGGLLLARGRADLGFYWNLSLVFLIPLCVFVGSHYGLVGAASTLLILQIILIIPVWFFLVKKACSASLSEYLLQMFKPFLIAVAAGILVSFILFIPIHNTFKLSISMVLFSLFFILIFKLLNKEMFTELMNLRKGMS